MLPAVEPVLEVAVPAQDFSQASVPVAHSEVEERLAAVAPDLEVAAPLPMAAVSVPVAVAFDEVNPQGYNWEDQNVVPYGRPRQPKLLVMSPLAVLPMSSPKPT